MNVTLPLHAELESVRIRRIYQKKNSTEIGQIKDKSRTSFDRLLTTSIEHIKIKDNLSTAEISLEKNRLLQLIEIIQTQINDSFFDALSEPDGNDGIPEFEINGLDLLRRNGKGESSVSKFQHASQETQMAGSKNDMDQIIDHASQTYGVDPDLIKSVIRAESNFDTNAVSSKGAMGLMQLMPETAKDLGVKDAYNPVDNIMGGTRYLKGLLDRYDGDIPLALAAYNWGMGNVEKHPGRLPRETRTYIARVSQFLQQEKSS